LLPSPQGLRQTRRAAFEKSMNMNTVHSIPKIVTGGIGLSSREMNSPPKQSSSSLGEIPPPYPIVILGQKEILNLFDPDSIIERWKYLESLGLHEEAEVLVEECLSRLGKYLEVDPENREANYSYAVLSYYSNRPVDAQTYLWLLRFIIDEDWKVKTPSAKEIPQLLFAANLLSHFHLWEKAGGKRVELLEAVLRTETEVPGKEHLDARLGLLKTFLEYYYFDLAQKEYDYLSKQLAKVDPKLANLYRVKVALGDATGALEALSKIPSFDYDFEQLLYQVDALLDSRPEWEKVPLSDRGDYIYSQLERINSEKTCDLNDLLLGFDLSLEVGDEVGAVEFLSQAKKLNPYSVEVFIREVDYLRWIGKFEDALSLIEKNLTYYPGLYSFYYAVLNDLYAAIGNSLILRAQGSVSRRLLQAFKKFTRYFPQSLDAWSQVATWAEWSFNLTTAEEARRKVLELLPPQATDAKRFLKVQIIRMRFFEGKNIILDGKPVELKDYKVNEKIETQANSVFPVGEELQLLLEEKYEWYFVKDKEEIIRYVKSHINSDSKDLSKLTLDEVIKLAAQITEDIIEYDMGKTQEADVVIEPIEIKLKEGDFKKGVCRHYAILFSAIFDSIKEINPNLVNAYVDISLNPNHDHAWNTVFLVKEDKIVAYVLDPTFDDGDKKFGNNLGGLYNYRQ